MKIENAYFACLRIWFAYILHIFAYFRGIKGPVYDCIYLHIYCIFMHIYAYFFCICLHILCIFVHMFAYFKDIFAYNGIFCAYHCIFLFTYSCILMHIFVSIFVHITAYVHTYIACIHFAYSPPPYGVTQLLCPHHNLKGVAQLPQGSLASCEGLPSSSISGSSRREGRGVVTASWCAGSCVRWRCWVPEGGGVGCWAVCVCGPVILERLSVFTKSAFILLCLNVHTKEFAKIFCNIPFGVHDRMNQLRGYTIQLSLLVGSPEPTWHPCKVHA